MGRQKKNIVFAKYDGKAKLSRWTERSIDEEGDAAPYAEVAEGGQVVFFRKADTWTPQFSQDEPSHAETAACNDRHHEV